MPTSVLHQGSEHKIISLRSCLTTEEVWTIVATPDQSSRRPGDSRPRDEVVAARSDDLDVEEVAGAVGRWVAFAQEYRRVDVRRLRFEARLQHEVVLARRAVHDHPHPPADPGLLALLDQRLLQ